jgi:UDP-N-acetylmuramoylalanine-D-glutamate ligase
MSQPTSWSDLAGARVGLWGLGVEGRANLHRLLALDTEPVLVDDAPLPDGCEGHEVLATWERGFEALLACEVVVKSPAPRCRVAWVSGWPTRRRPG